MVTQDGFDGGGPAILNSNTFTQSTPSAQVMALQSINLNIVLLSKGSMLQGFQRRETAGERLQVAALLIKGLGCLLVIFTLPLNHLGKPR